MTHHQDLTKPAEPHQLTEQPQAPIQKLTQADLERLGYRSLSRAEYDDLVLMEEFA